MRKTWIDAARGIAILAAIYGHFMDNFMDFFVKPVWIHLAFTIPWFIYLAGVTSGYSLGRENLSYKLVIKYYFRRLAIIPIYILGALFAVALTSPLPTLGTFIWDLVHFHQQLTFYFVLLILELYLLAPVIYVCLHKLSGTILQVIFLLILFLISIYLPIFKAPGPLSHQGLILGGGYLGIFALGIFTGFKSLFDRKIFFPLSVIVFLTMEYFLLQTNGAFWPGHYYLCLQLWSISLLFIIKPVLSAPVLAKPISMLAIVGRSSLVLFLFHYAILLWFKNNMALAGYYQFGALISAILLPLLAYVGGRWILSKLFVRLNKRL